VNPETNVAQIKDVEAHVREEIYFRKEKYMEHLTHA
jgi:hypothetical protein